MPQPIVEIRVFLEPDVFVDSMHPYRMTADVLKNPRGRDCVRIEVRASGGDFRTEILPLEAFAIVGLWDDLWDKAGDSFAQWAQEQQEKYHAP